MPTPLLLLVDDAPEIALIVQHLARRAGQEVCWQQDVPTAWEALRNGDRPDVVLLDYNLPGVSGIELIRLLRADAALASIPVALLSAWDRPEDICAALEAGADFVASKDLLAAPLSWQKRVREILSAADGRNAARSLICQDNRRPHSPANSPEAVLASLARALKQGCVRQLGSDVLEILLRRAYVQALSPETAPWNAASSPLLGAGLDADRLLRQLGPEGCVVFVAALAEQLWCVLGQEALEPWCSATNDAQA
jgi:CheY-like chemotaxis protein